MSTSALSVSALATQSQGSTSRTIFAPASTHSNGQDSQIKLAKSAYQLSTELKNPRLKLKHRQEIIRRFFSDNSELSNTSSFTININNGVKVTFNEASLHRSPNFSFSREKTINREYAEQLAKPLNERFADPRTKTFEQDGILVLNPSSVTLTQRTPEGSESNIFQIS